MRGIIIIASFIFSMALLVFGTWTVLSNFFQPQGYLFEGTVLAGIGMLGILMVVIASSIGNTIMKFTEIYEKQMEISSAIQKHYQEKSRGPRSISELFGGLPGQSSITVTDLDTGETTSSDSDSIEKINDIISRAASKYKERHSGGSSEKRMDDMNIEELEKELSTAVKKDDYEKAAEIREKIKAKRNNSDDENTEN